MLDGEVLKAQQSMSRQCLLTKEPTAAHHHDLSSRSLSSPFLVFYLPDSLGSPSRLALQKRGFYVMAAPGENIVFWILYCPAIISSNSAANVTCPISYGF